MSVPKFSQVNNFEIVVLNSVGYGGEGARLIVPILNLLMNFEP
jgi:hypothetical protein